MSGRRDLAGEGHREGAGLGVDGKVGQGWRGGGGVEPLTGFSSRLNMGMWRERVLECFQSTGITCP